MTMRGLGREISSGAVASSCYGPLVPGREKSIEQPHHGLGAPLVRVIATYAGERPATDLAGVLGRERGELPRHIGAVAGDQNLLAGLEKAVDAIPVIGDDAGRRAG